MWQLNALNFFPLLHKTSRFFQDEAGLERKKSLRVLTIGEKTTVEPSSTFCPSGFSALFSLLDFIDICTLICPYQDKKFIASSLFFPRGLLWLNFFFFAPIGHIDMYIIIVISIFFGFVWKMTPSSSWGWGAGRHIGGAGGTCTLITIIIVAPTVVPN